MTEKTKKISLWLLDLLVNVVIIFALVLIIQKWIIAPFDVSGASMCDTLNIIDGECVTGKGEKIIINEAGYLLGEPERGNIVVFKTEESDGKYFIKRVIGLPGETVEIKDGKVYITQKNSTETMLLDEIYLNSSNRNNTRIHNNRSVFEVPEGFYLLMGDNRSNSTDSRSCFQGSSVSALCADNPEKAFVSREDLRGKAWVVWWPLSNIRTISQSSTDSLLKPIQNP